MKTLLSIITIILFISGCGSSGKSTTTSKEITDNKTDMANNNKFTKNLPIVIIGPSTVYIAKEGSAEFHYSDDSECLLYGWGELLGEFSNENSEVYNYAQPGAGAGTFKIPPSQRLKSEQVLFGPNRDHYWAPTKDKMTSLKEGILLIQFGGNDPRHLMEKYPNATHEELGKYFKKNVKFYVDEAKRLNFIPILITSIEKRIKKDGKLIYSRGDMPKWMREVASEENVRFLDLNKKSYVEYDKYTEDEWKVKFADCYNIWRVNELMKKDGLTKEEAKPLAGENTHFEKHGAKEVASWIKELACEKSESTLCKQFR